MPTSTTPDEVPLYATDGNYGAGAETWSATARLVATGIEAWAAAGATPEQPRLAQSENEYLRRVAEGLAWLRGEAGTGVFGDGSDGDVVLAAGTTTLTRDMFYDDLTVPNGETLATAGYRVFVLGTLTIGATGVIVNSGGDASGGTGGTAGGAGTLTGGATGAAGVSDGAGLVGTAGSGTSSTLGVGGMGGAGGDTDAGPQGGAGGVSSTVAASGGFRVLAAANGRSLAALAWTGGGAGGSGGTQDGSGTSGAGGGGGGLVVVWARIVDNQGTISANGGDGGDAAAGNTTSIGGGGGGGGGAVWLLHREAVGAVLGTLTATGGAGGTGDGTGTAGDDGTVGSAGNVVTLIA